LAQLRAIRRAAAAVGEHVGALNFGLDQELLKALRRQIPLEIFVETGTFEAGTTLAAAPLFRRVWTMELSAELHERARQKLAHLSHVEALCGSSPKMLRAFAPQWSAASVLYWLDAHWCGGVTGGATQECPLLGELDALGGLNEESVVLIDDARYFLGPPPAPHNAAHWPRLLDVIAALRQLSTRHDLWAINDVLIYAPDRIATDVVEYGRTHGIDIAALASVAVGNARAAAIRGSQIPESGFNQALATEDRSERIFAFHAKRRGVQRLLDIGANTGQFAAKMRRFGFDGTIFSVEPLPDAHIQLRQHAQPDVRWIPLPRQAAGRARSRLALNVAQNGWSSSLLPTHENHLRAAPQARTIAHETVFVTKTADLLRSSLMREIDALKIDVQGYELEVIEGFRSCMDGIDLLLLEMSLVECYVGAPNLFALDRLLVDELGFSRVSFEPSYYDDQAGVVQQFDGIYVRDRPRSIPRSAATAAPFSAVVTSMHGAPVRVTPSGLDIGLGWLKRCVQSWQEQSQHIISVSETSPADQHVRWVETQARPAIADLLAAVPDTSNEPAILCNADILLSEALMRLRSRLDVSTFYFAHRIEVEVGAATPQAMEIKGYYEWGFDLFVLPPAFARLAREFPPFANEFYIGEPWWDYLLPLVAAAAGFPVKRLPINEGFALHYRHPTRYQQATWLKRGEQFMAAVAALTHTSARDIDLLHDLNALEGPLEPRLLAASKLVCSRLG
jgi:FkbM family methyltransferase